MHSLMAAPNKPARRVTPFTILVVEDDPSDTELMLHALEQADLKSVGGELQLEVRATAEGALRVLESQAVDLIITDYILPGLDGLDLISQIQASHPDLPVLVVTRVNAVTHAVEAMRRGAFDYLLKPVDPQDLGMRVHRAIRYSEILRRNAAYERSASQNRSIGQLVGVGPAFQRLYQDIQEAARVRSTVLIQGETGTGKGLIAKAIHETSAERTKPFQVIDCATVPDGMVESELFGHVRGAFTGAVADKPGLIELAHGGTVFLDEIGELPLLLQSKLLRVLEDGEVRPLGGTRVKRVDIRVVAATNQDLDERVRTGAFRKDLYFRLAVVSIRVPPLRKRIEDVPVIARALVEHGGREMGKPSIRLDQSAIDALCAYPWPGNVRELRNVMERAVMISRTPTISGETIHAILHPGSEQVAGEGPDAAHLALPYMDAKRQVVAEFTREYLRAKLAAHDGVVSKAAESCGIPRQHFALLMKRYLDQADE
ncbi:MAG: sigma-54 dependent transcriptional regulator [Nitrospiraceae bacterium]